MRWRGQRNDTLASPARHLHPRGPSHVPGTWIRRRLPVKRHRGLRWRRRWHARHGTSGQGSSWPVYQRHPVPGKRLLMRYMLLWRRRRLRLMALLPRR